MFWRRVALLVVIVAVTFQPILMPALEWLIAWPVDEEVGSIAKLSPTELVAVYQNKSVLVVGGTRGTGFGTALVLARSGAHITLVGRRESTGKQAVEKLQQLALSEDQTIQYQPGDIGSVRTALELVDTLKASSSQRYDFLVVSAGVWPDWASLKNEDGLEKSFAIGVVGRFLLYRHMHSFLKPTARVMNILASGLMMPYSLDRALAVGSKDPTSLHQALVNLCTAHDLMLMGLEERHAGGVPTFTRVSTHPGVVATQLHGKQGFWIDNIIALGELAMAVSEEECGLQHASVLASPKLHEGKLNYWDAVFSKGRRPSALLQKQKEQHLDWLWNLLMGLDVSESTESTSTEQH